MERTVLVTLLAFGLAALPAAAPLSAQTAQSHSDPICGFHLTYPAGWTKRVNNDRSVEVTSPDPEVTLLPTG